MGISLVRYLSILLFVSGLLSGCKLTTDDDPLERNSSLERIAQLAISSVEKEMQVDLSAVEWEMADWYKISRLKFRYAHQVYKKTISDRAYARLYAQAVASNSADNVLGMYKHNLKKVYISSEKINEERLEEFLKESSEGIKLHDIKSLKKEIYQALFIHEFVHAADRVRLSKYYNPDIYTPGKTEVFNVLLEGNAEHITEKICADIGCLLGYKYLADYDSDLSHIEDKEKRRFAQLRQDRRKFVYNQGQVFVDTLYQKSGQKDPIIKFVKELPDSLMVVQFPEDKRLLASKNVSAQKMLESLGKIKEDYPVDQWIHHSRIVFPFRMNDLLKTYIKTNLDTNRQLPYEQAVMLTLKKLDYFSIYDDEIETNNSYFILRDLGSETLAKASYNQDVFNVNDRKKNRYLSVHGLSNSSQPEDNYQSINIGFGKSSTSLIQKGRYILLVVTDRKIFKSNKDIADSVKKIFDSLLAKDHV